MVSAAAHFVILDCDSQSDNTHAESKPVAQDGLNFDDSHSALMIGIAVNLGVPD